MSVIFGEAEVLEYGQNKYAGILFIPSPKFTVIPFPFCPASKNTLLSELRSVKDNAL